MINTILWSFFSLVIWAIKAILGAVWVLATAFIMYQCAKQGSSVEAALWLCIIFAVPYGLLTTAFHAVWHDREI